IRAGVFRYASRRFARYIGVGRPIRKYASRSSSGIGSVGFVETSCRMISIGKIGASASGPTGSFVAGLSGGGKGRGRSGRMLYHARGTSSTSRRIFTASAPTDSDRSPCIVPTWVRERFSGQYITILFVDAQNRT